jgi:hypothetical protein
LARPFYAGGEVYRAGADIAQVELRFANGVTLSDDGDADVALFITESSVQLPATAVLRDPAGNEIRSETAFRQRLRISQLQRCLQAVRADAKAGHVGSVIGTTARCRLRLTAAPINARLDR